MDNNNETDSPSRLLYQRYRQSMKSVPEQTASAEMLYKINRQRLDAREAQLDRVIDAIKRSEQKKQKVELSERLSLLHRIISSQQWIVVPSIAACMLIVVVMLLNSTGTDYPKQRVVLLPASLTDIADIIEPLEPAQLGLMRRDYLQQQLFQLGVSTTQVALMSDQSQQLQSLASQLQVLSEQSELFDNFLKNHSQAWRSKHATNNVVQQAIGRLHTDFESSQLALLGWYRLGQLTESLRISLLVAELRGDTTAFKDVQKLIVEHDPTSLDSDIVPKLGAVIDEIMQLSVNTAVLERSDRRKLLRLTEQVNALLQ